jgi:two-component system chemotaxis response regulator CheB
MIRVLVVEDSLTMRRRICEVLESDPQFDVVGEAEDGSRAVELCSSLRPDVVTLDMILPVMTGLSATEYIMAHFPTPILVVSSSTNRGELFKTYDALSAGAVDVIEKPRGDEQDGQWEARFLSTVKRVSRIKVITHPRARLGRLGQAPAAAAPALEGATGAMALGASTGGPTALVQVLRDIPRGLPCPLFVVLHIDDPFGAAFAEWLGDQTSHPVASLVDGQRAASLRGRIVLAPPGRHLVVREGRIRFTMDAPRHSCRPSIDVLFESLALEYRGGVIACLLTGMGKDGAAGLLQIRRAGGLTVAQDEATSVVYGMPREAALLGAAEHILPLDQIGPAMAGMRSTARRDGP